MVCKRARPVLLVLAGVNGAGKSSIGGNLMLRRAGLSGFNADSYTRLLMAGGLAAEQANALAWQHGVDLIDQAIATGQSHAFETTLGGNTIRNKIEASASTHDVLIWFCGLSTPEQHMARVASRVAAGGHDIPRAKILQRWLSAPLNLIQLMPAVHELRVFDNSAEAAIGQPVEDPQLVLHLQRGLVKFPVSLAALKRTPQWAKAIVKAALDLQRSRMAAGKRQRQ